LVTEDGQHVEPYQVLVALARRGGQLGHLQPMRDGLSDGNCSLGVAVLVHLALKLRQRHFGCAVRLRGLPEVPELAGQRVDAGIYDGAEAARGQLLYVAAGTAPATDHQSKVARPVPRLIPRTTNARFSVRAFAQITGLVPPAGFDTELCPN
jgi:hypothetical protein